MGDLRVGGDPLRPLVVLGATGSIGGQTVEVAQRVGAPIAAIASRRASHRLLDLATELPDATVCVVEIGDRREEFEAALGDRLHIGSGAITEVAASHGVTVVNGIVGSAGLSASLAALYAGNRLALANKESLVAGGPLIRAALEEGGGELIPIDSEHAAIWQTMLGEPDGSLERIVLTASGGPFRGWTPDQIAAASVEDALNHPTWNMGQRITVDSATLMNKAFEVIEAHYLFGLPYDRIDVVVHPQSIVHSFVELSDGVVKAEVGNPDMRKPIQYAITSPERVPVDHEPFEIAGVTLTFEEPDRDAFPCLDLGYAAGRIGGTAPAVLNAADEVAVARFLDGLIPFGAIGEVVAEVTERHTSSEPQSVDDVAAADREGRALAAEACERYAT